MTSSNHPEHIIGNVFIRVQAEKELKAEQPSISDTQEAHVSKLASSLPNFGNTVISKQMLVSNFRPWQTHLERICDFLLAGEGIWWRTCNNGDIEYFDAKGNHEAVPQGPTLHHFRSSNFKKEEAYLKHCWQTCLKKKIEMPVKVLQVENAEGNMVFMDTNQEREGMEVGCAGRAIVGQGCTPESEDVGVVDESVVGCDTVVGCDAELGCDAVVAGGDDVVGCDDIVQTGELEVDVEYNVRLVEVSEDNVVCFENDHQGEANQTGSNSEANTMKPKNRDKGTCTNICINYCSIIHK